MVNPIGSGKLDGHKFNGLRRQLLLIKHIWESLFKAQPYTVPDKNANVEKFT